MEIETELPGLAHLLHTCHTRGFPLKSFPPAKRPLLPGARLCNLPVDPLLLSIYQRMGGLHVANFFGLLRFDDQIDSLTKTTELICDDENNLFRSFLIFGGEPSLLYFYATLPALANEAGHQPVFYLDAYSEPYALPLASNVDLFFDLYARYLELMVGDAGYQADGVPELSFPWGIPHLLAQDKPLVDMLRQGRFAPWLPKEGHPSEEEVRAWLRQVLAAHEGGPMG